MSRTARKQGRIATVSRAPQQVRIIGGQWKRTPLPVPEAEGLRPTPDRVRETVFNWITHLVGGDWERMRCLDLFAGSGALGFEAASRGAPGVMMVENFGPAVRQLEASKTRLDAGQVDIRRGDALVVLKELNALQSRERFNLIFADPPYHHDWLAKILPLCEQILSEDGLIYAESEQALDGVDAPGWMDDWNVVRADKAGMVFYHLLQRKKQP